MIAGVPASTLALLVVLSLFAGVGITAVGPGGVFITIALVALTDLPPPVVVGTASATFVATGLVGTESYRRSGELDSRAGQWMAGVLSLTGLVGALVGVRLNALVDAATFRVLLGVFVSLTGVLVYYRTRHASVEDDYDVTAVRGTLGVAGIGGFVGVSGGLLGVGGPVLAVPLLVAVGVPMLVAVGVAQLQSVFVAAFATLGYLAQGAVSWPLAVAIGIPEIAGVVAGWKLAQSVNSRRLTRTLAVLLLILGPYIVLR